jgi:hypothetical protein
LTSNETTDAPASFGLDDLLFLSLCFLEDPIAATGRSCALFAESNGKMLRYGRLHARQGPRMQHNAPALYAETGRGTVYCVLCTVHGECAR